MDTTQFLLSTILTVSTLLVVVVGIQFIFVLKELKKTLRRFREFIDETPEYNQPPKKENQRRQEKKHGSVQTVIEKIKFFNLPKSS